MRAVPATIGPGPDDRVVHVVDAAGKQPYRTSPGVRPPDAGPRAAAPGPGGTRAGPRLPYAGCRIARRWLRTGIVASLVATQGATPSDARQVEYVISFDGVVVTHPDGVVHLPDVAHVDPEPAEAVASDGTDRAGTPAREGADWAPAPRRNTPFGQHPDVSREGRLLDAALDHKLIELSGPWILFNGSPIGRGRANAKKRLAESPGLYKEIETRVRALEMAARTAAGAPPARRAPILPGAFAPGQPVAANPSFVQHGFRVESFWAVRTGSPEGYYARAHFHPPDLTSDFEAQHFGNQTELHGIHIRALDGKPFGLKSLRYRVTRNRQLRWKPLSIEGFNNFAVYVLVSRVFDPRKSVRAQFTALPVGLALGNDPTLPWFSLPVLGFEFAEELFIASSASVDVDDIVLVRSEVDSPDQAPDSSPGQDEANPSTR